MQEEANSVKPDLPIFVQLPAGFNVDFHQPNQSKSRPIYHPVKITHYRTKTFLEHEIAQHQTPGPGTYTKAISVQNRKPEQNFITKSHQKLPEIIDLSPFYNTEKGFNSIKPRAQSPSLRQCDRFARAFQIVSTPPIKTKKLSKFCNW